MKLFVEETTGYVKQLYTVYNVNIGHFVNTGKPEYCKISHVWLNAWYSVIKHFKWIKAPSSQLSLRLALPSSQPTSTEAWWSSQRGGKETNQPSDCPSFTALGKNPLILLSPFSSHSLSIPLSLFLHAFSSKTEQSFSGLWLNTFMHGFAVLNCNAVDQAKWFKEWGK